MPKLTPCFLLLMLVPTHAFAQGAPAEEPAEQPRAQDPEPGEPVEQTDRPVEPVLVKDKKTNAEKKNDDEEEADDSGSDASDTDHGRFRGGVSGMIGAFLPPAMFQIGAAGRLGYQINDLFAVYGGFGSQAGFGIGVGSDEDGTSASVSFGGGVFAEAIFEVTLADIFFVGTGPVIMYGAFVSVDQAVSVSDDTASASQNVSVFSGTLPGIKLRTGVGFGKNRPDRRKQFTLALEGTVLFGERYATQTTAGTGGASAYVRDGVAVGFLPMLSLGYDAK